MVATLVLLEVQVALTALGGGGKQAVPETAEQPVDKRAWNVAVPPTLIVALAGLTDKLFALITPPTFTLKLALALFGHG